MGGCDKHGYSRSLDSRMNSTLVVHSSLLQQLGLLELGVSPDFSAPKVPILMSLALILELLTHVSRSLKERVQR